MAQEPAKTPSDNQARNGLKEARSAIEFWQALEYLTPQKPPPVSARDFAWEFGSDAPEHQFPWNDPKKREILNGKFGSNKKFQIYSGIIVGDYFIETAREYLGAPAIDSSELPPPSPVACVCINVDGNGLASEQVFVSTVPWAMAELARSAGTGAPLNFRGFFGMEGLEQELRGKVKDLMVERRLLAKEPDGAPQQAVAAEDLEPAAPIDSSSAETPAAVADSHAAAQSSVQPITGDDIKAITELVFEFSGWRPQQQKKWIIKAQWAPENSKDDNPASQEDLLNSFYAQDLENLGDAVAGREFGAGLRAYLSGEDSADRVDLEIDKDALIAGVHPSRLPPGCWPAKHPLVTAQQFAVNAVMADLANGEGLFSVNGPPGTGKTTMLKDIIAAIVVNRADAMMGFDSPSSAFKKCIDIEDYKYAAYELDPSLRGFGIVVSSANNGAVENITKELPGLAALAPDIDIDYFSMVADSIAAPGKAKKRGVRRERWGLFTAVLGSKANREQFANRLWLTSTPKKPKEGNTLPKPDPYRFRSLKDVVSTGEDGALPWDMARRQYRAARDKVVTLTRTASVTIEAIQKHARGEEERKEASATLKHGQTAIHRQIGEVQHANTRLDESVKAYERTEQWLALCTEWSDADSDVKTQQDTYDALSATIHADAVEEARQAKDLAIEARQQAELAIEFHHRTKPNFLSELFRTQYSRRWNKIGTELETQLLEARSNETSATTAVATEELQARKLATQARTLLAAKELRKSYRLKAMRAEIPLIDGDDTLPTGLLDCLKKDREAVADDVRMARSKLREAQELLAMTQLQVDTAGARLERAEADLMDAKRVLDKSPVPADKEHLWDLAKQERDVLHRATPYEFPALFEARRDVFVAAMRLHQAFIVAAWSTLSPTLSAVVDLLKGNLNAGQIVNGPSPLWDALFLVVPVVSSTFASFPRLFRGIKSEQLAWLLIDEAGQAAPQQAVGAIWRSKRSVIVGDPLQLEPVVGLPKELVPPLLRRCSAESQWAPPSTSAQTLADRANRFGMHLKKAGSEKATWLGSPLLVHRRCLDPMFAISNEIAYDDKMVYGAGEDSGPPGIGQSRWIHVPARLSEGHWVEAQGQHAMELVAQISGDKLKESGQFKVYVITPFRAVAKEIRERLFEKYGIESVGMSGTVHTFQGKEADSVIFLLGGDPSNPGVISNFAGATPNLVNVAVTRAKRRLYVIGDLGHWTGACDSKGIFTRMAWHLAAKEEETKVAV